MRRERLRKARRSSRPGTSGASRPTRKAGAVMPIIRAYVGEAAGVDTSGATERMAPLPAVKSVGRHESAARSERNANEERFRTLLRRRALCTRIADALAADDRADSLAARAVHALLDDIDAELRGLARGPATRAPRSPADTVPSSAGSCFAPRPPAYVRFARGVTR